MRPDRFVVADDFGLCPEIDEAVCRLHDAGAVHGFSFMVNTDLFEDSVRRAKERPRLEPGIHLNLTDGRPVLPAGEVPSLVNREGRFIGGRHYAVLWRIVTGRFKAGEIEAEWRAQIRKANEAGVRIRHLNAHGHLHLVPRLHGIVVRILRDFQIPYVRLVLTPRSLKSRIFVLLSRKLLAAIRRDGLRVEYPEEILGITHQGGLDREKILSELRRPVRGRVEFIVHPSDGRNPYHDSWGYRTEDEFAGLLDPEVVSRLAGRTDEGK